MTDSFDMIFIYARMLMFDPRHVFLQVSYVMTSSVQRRSDIHATISRVPLSTSFIYSQIKGARRHVHRNRADRDEDVIRFFTELLVTMIM